MSKDPDAPPKLFFIYEPNVGASEDSLQAAVSRQATMNPNLPFVRNVVAQGVGTGIAMGIIAAIGESERGKVVLMPQLPDEAFLKKLQTAIQASKE